jgi:hypothetical protein
MSFQKSVAPQSAINKTEGVKTLLSMDSSAFRIFLLRYCKILAQNIERSEVEQNIHISQCNCGLKNSCLDLGWLVIVFNKISSARILPLVSSNIHEGFFNSM